MNVNKTSKTIVYKLLLLFGILLLLSAFAIVVLNFKEAKNGKISSETVLDNIASYFDEKNDCNYIEFDGKRYYAEIFIPELNICLPIMDEINHDNLQLAPCRYSGHAESGDLIIAGHNYASHFGPLKKIRPGAEIMIKTASGINYVYKVDCVENLSAWQVEEMETGEWELSLFTCTLSGKDRITVRCSLSG